ncbi:MAG: helix-turn-helix transcriptional regulator [Deltaproteobacteria bacterium]|nr:helix-turn-helix transcriptional regulator [Deltaproteobacteria bacterium]MBI3390317.1 helix-turn-helix transcriptional regulator [Deltaproteobacteria bacterium]
MSSKLTNYLRTFRKRSGLSQEEVAFLLGCRFGAKVSRYERFEREPNLRTALSYEVIFHTKVHELFAGIYEQVERDAGKRARRLARRLAKQHVSERKLAALKAITEPPSDDLRWEPIVHP